MSLTVLPAILIWLRWRALDRPSPQWLLPAWLAATATSVTYFAVRSTERTIEQALNLAPGAGAWIPLALFVIAGMTRDYFARQTPYEGAARIR